jgi:lipopolysaccharide export system permease protein
VGAIGLILLRASQTERAVPLVAAAQRVIVAGGRLVRRLRPTRRPKAAGITVRRVRTRRSRRVARSYGIFSVVDRYLVLEFLTFFAYGVALVTVVVVIGDLMTVFDRFMRLKPEAWHIVEHFLYRTPPYVYQGLHIVVLMSTILLFLNLSRTHELTALKAGGMSLYRVSLPVFGLAATVMLGAYGFQEIVLPVLNQKGVEVDETKIRKRTLPHLQKRSQIWYRGKEGPNRESRIYHIDLLDPATREMSGVSILELGWDFTLLRRWDAKAMRWREVDQSWELLDGVSRQFDPGQADRVEPFRQLALRFPEQPEDFAQVPKAPDVMNYIELRAYIQRLQEGGHKVAKYMVDLDAKLALPVAHLIMALVGIPFALQSPRGGRLIGVALCLALGLSYFLVHSAALALARTEILPPMVGAWAANGLFGSLGFFFFLRART